MATLNIRQLPDDVHANLRILAARNGRSMEAEARDILSKTCSPGYDAADGSGLLRDASVSGADQSRQLTLHLSAEQTVAAQRFARQHGITLEDLLRQLLDQRLAGDADDWCNRLFSRMDQAGGNSHGARWTREELYDRS